MPEPQSSENVNITGVFFPPVLAVGALIVYLACAFTPAANESTWTSVLFAIPVFVLAAGSIIIARRVHVNKGNIKYYTWNLTVTTVSIGVYCLFWYLYVVGPNHDWLKSAWCLQTLSVAALVVITLLLIFVAIMTSAFVMSPPKVKPTKRFASMCDGLRCGVRDEPLWAVALFFVLFLEVAYLFGFALAFHDRYAMTLSSENNPGEHRPALRMINLKSIDDLGPQPEKPAQGAGHAEQKDAAPAPAEGDSEFYFYFNGGEASFSRSPSPFCVPTNIPKRTDRNLVKPQEFNDCTLKAIVERINQETKEDQRIRIFLIGHSSSEPIGQKSTSQSYFSNYELSEARAQNVRYEILQMFQDEKWHNIEWHILPASDEHLPQLDRGLAVTDLFTREELETRFTKKELTSQPSSEDIEKRFSRDEIAAKLNPEKRLVVAIIKPVKQHITTLQMDQIHQSQFAPLRLMDYMYFSIYTITTTGYGDIVPTTAYAKFVTSLANICEVLFLVVFFNALISIKGNRDPEKAKEDSQYTDSGLAAGTEDTRERDGAGRLYPVPNSKNAP